MAIYNTRKLLSFNQKLSFDDILVGAAGFEPTTPCPPDKCATGLRYAPTGAVVASDPRFVHTLHFLLRLNAFHSFLGP